MTRQSKKAAPTSSSITWILPNTPRVLLAIAQLLALPNLESVDVRRSGEGWAVTVTVPKTPGCQRLPQRIIAAALAASDHPLVGAVVTAVRPMNAAELEAEGWAGRVEALDFSSGALLYAASGSVRSAPGVLVARVFDETFDLLPPPAAQTA